MCNPNLPVWNCIFAIYPLPLLFLALGLLLVLILLLSVNTQSLFAGQDPSAQKPLLKVKDWELYAFTLPQRIRQGLRLAGMGLLLIGLLWIIIGEIRTPLIDRMQTSTSTAPNCPPSVHLVGMGYMVGDWKPMMVNLRASTDQGIDAYPGDILRIIGVSVYSDEKTSGEYQVQVELLANNSELIGSTKKVPLFPGIIELGAIEPSQYQLDDNERNWIVQDNWDRLSANIKVYDPKNETSFISETFHIRLMPTDKFSGWLEPPYASLAVVVYQVNQDEKQTIDFRIINDTGIEVQPGDTLHILEIWYRSLTPDNNKFIHADAYLDLEQYDSETLVTSLDIPIKSGINNLIGVERLEWEIPPGKSRLILTLLRDEGLDRSVVLDRLIIPLIEE